MRDRSGVPSWTLEENEGTPAQFTFNKGQDDVNKSSQKSQSILSSFQY